MSDADEAAVRWLLESDEPSVVRQTRRDVLGEPVPERPDDVLNGAKVTTLLSGQQPDGGFGVHPYRKWTGAHWRLVSLVELEIPPGHPAALRAMETVFRWLTARGRLDQATATNGLTYHCASMEGNALAVACRLGLASDPRAEDLARHLVQWQWPDGGWNCDRAATGRRSSFHESLATMWGLHEYAVAAEGALATEAARAAERTAELLLDHRVFKTADGSRVINKAWLALHYPPYWHYDVLQALHILARMGRASDPRTADAVEHLRHRRLPDGRWRPGAYWWSTNGGNRLVEVVDWGRGGPNEHITLNALRVLRAAASAPPEASQPRRQ